LGRLAVPLFNTVYADRDGNILYVYTGRRAAPLDQVRLDQARRRIRSRSRVEGYHSLDELPQVFNPSPALCRTATLRRLPPRV
jgi:acyl-homoserine lactone acylase PvdQ